jgi:hypothetical protein
VYIVALREILPEVAAAAFLSSQRGSRDQKADRHQTRHAPQFAITRSC